MRRPTLATDVDYSTLRYPCIVQPKIDGVRGVSFSGRITGRSLKPFGNLGVEQLFSSPLCHGLDGELLATEGFTDPASCRATTSAVSAHYGDLRDLHWVLFDLITTETEGLPYFSRLERLKWRLEQIIKTDPKLSTRLDLIPSNTVGSFEELELWEGHWVSHGYEGIVIRDPEGKAKPGRSTTRDQVLLRHKRFADAEGVVVDILEGNENLNPGVVNQLGLLERSSAKADLIPNGQVGTIMLRLLIPLELPLTTLPAGTVISVSPGRLTLAERTHLWRNPREILGKMAKFQYFAHGALDKPRFPTFQCFRDPVDLSC